jgi:hypothetical protein
LRRVIRSEAVRVREVCQTYSKDGMILLRDLEKLHVGLTRQIEQFLARLTDGTVNKQVVSDARERHQFENPYLRKIEHKMLQSGVYPPTSSTGVSVFSSENKHYVLSTIDSKKDGRVDLSWWLRERRSQTSFTTPLTLGWNSLSTRTVFSWSGSFGCGSRGRARSRWGRGGGAAGSAGGAGRRTSPSCCESFATSQYSISSSNTAGNSFTGLAKCLIKFVPQRQENTVA